MVSAIHPTQQALVASAVHPTPAHSVRFDAPVRQRFSLAKLGQLTAYRASTSRARHVVVILFFAVPSVLTSLVSCSIPLNDPSRGFSANRIFLAHISITFFLTFLGAMMEMRVALNSHQPLVTRVDVIAIGLVATVPFIGVVASTAAAWRFPIPFFWGLSAVPWLVSFFAGNRIILHRQWALVGPSLLAHFPPLILQLGQIVVYPTFSALFEAGNATQQVALILVFPALKFGLKKGIFILTRRSNRELASISSTGSVEICASMYQSMIMQTTPSAFATALLIGIDVVQGFFEIWRCTHGSAVATGNASSLTVSDSIRDQDLDRFATPATTIWPRAVVAKLASMVHKQRGMTSTAPSGLSSDGKKAWTQTLELLQAAETILLVEYIEVAVPLVNALYLAVATQVESAMYNPKLRGFHEAPSTLGPAIGSLVLYTALQATTLVVMAAILQYRLKLSALTLLAFVLETHVASLQGKLIAWLAALFAFPIVHYGALIDARSVLFR